MTPYIVRKSWIAYVGCLLSIVISLIVIGLIVYRIQELWAWSDENFGNERLIGLLLPLLLPISWLAWASWHFFLLRSEVLTIDDSGVRFRRGILPWRIEQRFWRPHQLFDCRYGVDRPFLEWLLRFGSIVIVDRAGVTGEYLIRGMHNPKRAQLLISGIIDRYHSGGTRPPA